MVRDRGHRLQKTRQRAPACATCRMLCATRWCCLYSRWRCTHVLNYAQSLCELSKSLNHTHARHVRTYVPGAMLPINPTMRPICALTLDIGCLWMIILRRFPFGWGIHNSTLGRALWGTVCGLIILRYMGAVVPRGYMSKVTYIRRTRAHRFHITRIRWWSATQVFECARNELFRRPWR